MRVYWSKASVCMFAIQLTASVWAVDRREPAGRSAFTQAAVNLLSFIIFYPSTLRPCGKESIKVRAELNG